MRAARTLTIVGCATVALVAAMHRPVHAVEVDPNIGTWADQIAPPPDVYLPADRPRPESKTKPRARYHKKRGKPAADTERR
jgi:hypothetical protein